MNKMETKQAAGVTIEISKKGKELLGGVDGFFFTYWDDERKKTVWEEKLTVQEAFDHLNTKGWASNMLVSWASGGKTFAKLMTHWDEDLEVHWHEIWTMAGDWVAREHKTR